MRNTEGKNKLGLEGVGLRTYINEEAPIRV
jgi:hypothetical protein